MGAQPTDLIQSVSRALRVLEQVTRADRPVPVKVIARQCGLNLSTAYHLVRTLSYEGYLVRCPDGNYAAGPELAERFHELAGTFGRPPSAGDLQGWWAIGVSARGVDLPGPVLAELKLAAADLGRGAAASL